jgi:uncharacterized protein YbjT (DUF2867 family)
MITVFGASGNTGGAAAAFLLEQKKKVRVVARQRDKLASLIKAGAEAAIGDMENGIFVQQALQGAEAAYVLIPPNLKTGDFRAYQRRVVHTLGDAIEESGVSHVVLLSSLGAQHTTGTGPIVGVHEFEERLSAIAKLNALFVRAGIFMQNVLMGLASIRANGTYGSPMPADAAVPMVAASDIGTYAGIRLARLDFSGKSAVHVIGPQPVSQTEVAETLSKVIGKPVRYAQVSLDDVEKNLRQGGLSPSVVSVFMEMNRGAGQGLVAPEEGLPVEHATTTFETFAQRVIAPAYRA